MRSPITYVVTSRLGVDGMLVVLLHSNLDGQIISGSEGYPVHAECVHMNEVRLHLHGASVLITPDEATAKQFGDHDFPSAIPVGAVRDVLGEIGREMRSDLRPPRELAYRSGVGQMIEAFATAQQLYSTVQMGTKKMRELLPTKLAERNQQV
jgi:hypothetical protein